MLPLAPLVGQDAPNHTHESSVEDWGGVSIKVEGKHAQDMVVKRVEQIISQGNPGTDIKNVTFYVLIPHQFEHGETQAERDYKFSVAYSIASDSDWVVHPVKPLVAENLTYSAGTGADPDCRSGQTETELVDATRRLVLMRPGYAPGTPGEESMIRNVRVVVFTPGIAIRAHEAAAFTQSGSEIPRPTEMGSRYHVVPPFIPEPEEPAFPPGDDRENYVKLNLRYQPNASQEDHSIVYLTLPSHVSAWDQHGNELPRSSRLTVASGGVVTVDEGPASLAEITLPSGVDIWARMEFTQMSGSMPPVRLLYRMIFERKSRGAHDEFVFLPVELKIMKPETFTVAEWQNEKFEWKERLDENSPGFTPLILDGKRSDDLKFKLSFGGAELAEPTIIANHLRYEFAIHDGRNPENPTWVTINLGDRVTVSPDKKELWCILSNADLVGKVRPPEPSDAEVLEVASYDIATTGHFGDSNAFDDAAVAALSATPTVNVRGGGVTRGNWTDKSKSTAEGEMRPWSSYENKDFIIGGGAHFLQIRVSGVTARCTIRNQADILYFSGHGHSEDGRIDIGVGKSVTADEVEWNDDLEMVIIAGCAVLDVGDFNNNYEEGKGNTGPKWAKTGPNVLLGYNHVGPSDGPIDRSPTADLATNFITMLPNHKGVVQTCRLWIDLNILKAKNAAWSYASACAIFKSGGKTYYMYYHDRGVLRGIRIVELAL